MAISAAFYATELPMKIALVDVAEIRPVRLQANWSAALTLCFLAHRSRRNIKSHAWLNKEISVEIRSF